MEKLKGGLIGFGRMGITHYSILNCHPDVEFVSMCDASGPMLKLVKKHLALATFEDVEVMLREVPLDFVIVSTPTRMHSGQVVAAIERGLHVFVEKPFSISPPEGLKVLKVLARKPVVNQVGYVLRFNDIMRFARTIIQKGEMGEVVAFKMEVVSPTVLKATESGWRGDRKQGGGCLFEMGSHAINLISYLLGVPDFVTGASVRSVFSKGVDDFFQANLGYKDGRCGVVTGNWSDASCRKPVYRVEISFTAGKLIADLHECRLFFRHRPSNPRFEAGWNRVYITEVAEPVRFYLRGYEFTQQLDCFVDVIKGRRSENPSSFSSGYETDMTLDRIVQQANFEK